MWGRGLTALMRGDPISGVPSASTRHLSHFHSKPYIFTRNFTRHFQSKLFTPFSLETLNAISIRNFETQSSLDALHAIFTRNSHTISTGNFPRHFHSKLHTPALDSTTHQHSAVTTSKHHPSPPTTHHTTVITN